MANFITESGFYDVLLYSDAPQVKPFRKWVTSEVLPSIRKNGNYSVKQNLPRTYLEALKELVVIVEEKERLQLENQKMKRKPSTLITLYPVTCLPI